jgi:hypothetical protein
MSREFNWGGSVVNCTAASALLIVWVLVTSLLRASSHSYWQPQIRFGVKGDEKPDLSDQACSIEQLFYSMGTTGFETDNN